MISNDHGCAEGAEIKRRKNEKRKSARRDWRVERIVAGDARDQLCQICAIEVCVKLLVLLHWQREFGHVWPVRHVWK